MIRGNGGGAADRPFRDAEATFSGPEFSNAIGSSGSAFTSTSQFCCSNNAWYDRLNS
jgi:hypothetical protein